jgi:hypothetical protein
VRAIAYYTKAKRDVVDLGFANEIEWQAAQDPRLLTESAFLREAAWVVYCSGFREATVRKYFDYISMCFYDWASAASIAARAHECVLAAMFAVANRRKHEAIVTIARRVESETFESFKERLSLDPVAELRQFPFLGAVTALHLAKNIGFGFAKPDRHLTRLGSALGFHDVASMCDEISAESGDSVQVVDLVLWRYLERTGAYPV